MNNKLNHSYIAGIPLLAHGFSVKLSPCPMVVAALVE